ncbi:MAG: sugar ABC transporter ATP-binding protein [Thermanaerothrix sp.]|uniref:sugar ABC transporter ATP-binding protein n=1 Tax=Thermanaerothrix sp. TaxID=2972675 RepID=UPI003C7B2AF0
MNKVSLSAQHLVKHYGGVVALADGNLEVNPGEVMTLVGANGSGKSTLGKIVTGVVAPDGGRLLLNDREVVFRTPHAARELGIVAVYQELSLVPRMTIAENIWLGHEWERTGGVLRDAEMRQRTRELLALFEGTTHNHLDPDMPISALSPGEKQIVEILKALSWQPSVLFLDEATASLDSRQVNRLFDLIQDWKRQGMAIVFISHRLDEIYRIADRVTVLRNGRTVAAAPISDLSKQELINLMIEGGVATRTNGKRSESYAAGEEVLRVESLSTTTLRAINLVLRRGELVGLGGLQGQGQTELLLALFGAIPYTGQIYLYGRPATLRRPQDAMRHQIAYVPGERNTAGLLPIQSILDNLLLPSWKYYGFPLRIRQAQADAMAVAGGGLKLVMAGLDQPVNTLSGGNAQKVVLGKWLLRRPRILLLDDPTKGVDVGTKGEFYKILSDLRAEGTAILFYSTDDEELLGLCDRVLVLHDGKITAELSGERLVHSELVAAAMGSST